MDNLCLKVENIVSKGEIAHYVFKKPSAAEASESVYMRERVNIDMTSLHILTYYDIC